MVEVRIIKSAEEIELLERSAVLSRLMTDALVEVGRSRGA